MALAHLLHTHLRKRRPLVLIMQLGEFFFVCLFNIGLTDVAASAAALSVTQPLPWIVIRWSLFSPLFTNWNGFELAWHFDSFLSSLFLLWLYLSLCGTCCSRASGVVVTNVVVSAFVSCCCGLWSVRFAVNSIRRNCAWATVGMHANMCLHGSVQVMDNKWSYKMLTNVLFLFLNVLRHY